ncbi:MAG: cell division protein CrgA [Actinomycetales bacterium]|nr:cell division protein CrgA [Actinomycetales bacterium]
MARPNPNARPEQGEDRGGSDAPNPVWFLPVMLGFMLVGLAWIVVYYLSGTQWPIPSLQNWNILIGFGIMLIGFLMTTRWR